MKLLIVGELNPFGPAPVFALYHLPRQSSGNRLRQHLGLRDATYHAIDKANLCTGKWTRQGAGGGICRLARSFNPTVVLLLGRKVQQAFDGPEFFQARTGCKLDRFGPDDTLYTWPSFAMVTLPHPSGMNPMWNEPTARARARALMREHVPSIPWGEIDNLTTTP